MLTGQEHVPAIPIHAVAPALALLRSYPAVQPRAPKVRDAWRFDTVNSSLAFSLRRMVVGRIRGQFTKWRGTMEFDPSRPEATKVVLRIDADSIETGDAERDARLRGADFLASALFPHLTFRSSSVVDRGGGQLAIRGMFEVRGVVREVVLDLSYLGSARDAWGNDHRKFRATMRIERGLFGLKWCEALPAPELLLGGAVEIAIDIEATRLPGNAT